MGIELLQQGGGFTLRAEGRTVLVHTAARPFAAAVRKDKVYKVSRGAVSVRETVRETIPLRDYTPAEDGAIFSAGGCVLRLRALPCPGGVEVRLEGTPGYAYSFSFPSAPEDGVFGGGEQYRRLNLKGARVPNLVSEHITLPTILEKGLLPPALCRPKEQIGSYAPMPVYVSSRCELLAFETDGDGAAEFLPEASRFTFDACPAAFTFLCAGDFAALARRQNARRENRQYLPDWCLDGMILGVQGGTARVLETAFAAQEAGMPVCGVWCQDWSGEKRTAMGKQVCWNWAADETLYPDLAGAIAQLRARGIRFLGYLNPYLLRDGPLYTLCKRRGYLITHEDGSVYHIKSTTFEAGMLDLTNPAAAAFLKTELIQKNLLSLGVSGYMADFGEYLPLDCVLHDGDPKLLHNRWPVLWAKLNREAIEEYGDPEVFFFTRAGYRGIQEYAPILWNGDQHVDFSPDYGLPCVMPASFSLGFSGVPLVHCDCGGFFSFLRMKRTEELMRRYLELSCFSMLMRSHESLRPEQNVQPYDPALLPEAARFARMHAALKPYLRHCLEEAKAGIPAMRPDFYATGDWLAHRDDYAYYLGGDLFVAPVTEAGAVTRRVCLPEGRWVHLPTGRRFGAGPCRVAAPVGTPAVFYRENSPFTPCFEDCAAEARGERKP